ncbi:unnamed protein product [Arctogadus glacialis]
MTWKKKPSLFGLTPFCNFSHEDKTSYTNGTTTNLRRSQQADELISPDNTTYH